RTDILLPSEGELELLTEQTSEADAVACALQQGVREIVLKRGGAGCSYYTASSHRDVAGFPAEELDPTGAGDIFGATFCTLRSQAMPPTRHLFMQMQQAQERLPARARWKGLPAVRN